MKSRVETKIKYAAVTHPDPKISSDVADGAFKSVESADPPHAIKAYDEIPVMEQTKLPRGGVSVETKAVGRVQVRFLYSISFYILSLCLRLAPKLQRRGTN